LLDLRSLFAPIRLVPFCSQNRLSILDSGSNGQGENRVVRGERPLSQRAHLGTRCVQAGANPVRIPAGGGDPLDRFCRQVLRTVATPAIKPGSVDGATDLRKSTIFFSLWFLRTKRALRLAHDPNAHTGLPAAVATSPNEVLPVVKLKRQLLVTNITRHKYGIKNPPLQQLIWCDEREPGQPFIRRLSRSI
jgi:hypothetical protein